jgi:hypothetical protein
MSSVVDFPYMRRELVGALESLSDLQLQSDWGRFEEGSNHYDDLELNIHILYDDCTVLPDPREAVGSVIFEEEVPVFLELEGVLGPMIDALGARPDEEYTNSPAWADVVEVAGKAFLFMRESDRKRERD